MGGFLIRYISNIRQKWANTYHHLASYILLPVIGYFITVIIKGDLALSLGMIGRCQLYILETQLESIRISNVFCVDHFRY